MYIEFGLFILIIVFTIFSIVRNIRLSKIKINNENPLESGIFCVQESIFIKNVSSICLGGFAFLLVVAIFSIYWQGKSTGNIVACLFFLVAFIFSLILFLYSQNWEVNVNKDKISYKNILGQLKEYSFKEIEVMQDKQYKVLVYQNNKRIFSISSNIVEYADFLWWANKYGVYRM